LYSSLTAYNYPQLAPGFISNIGGYTVLESTDLSGTAAKYLSMSDPAAPYIYVIEIARDCSSSTNFCVELASKGTEDELVISEKDPIVFIERNYINPAGTKSGPAVAETIMPKLIHFRSRKPLGVFEKLVAKYSKGDFQYCDDQGNCMLYSQ